MNKFEQLIEYVINDEEDKARELFHEIVVEKSRNIYEEIMAEEDVTEETVEEAKEEEEELEESKEEEEEVEESVEETMVGGDQADRLIDEIEVEEEGMSMEAEGDEDMADAELEDRVVDLEDKLDELMAEFEALMGGEGGEEAEMDMDMDMDAAGDEVEMDDTELETESLGEGMDLKAAPKPVTSEEGSVNTKSTVAANSGAKGMEAKPVSETGGEEKGRPAPQAKDLGVTPTQDAGKGAFKSAAPKATMKEPAGINTKSVN